MRESGMTNSEIAQTLEINKSTVYKYIGAMPNELKNKAKCKAYFQAKQIERNKFDNIVPQYDVEVLTERIKANNITIDINRKSTSCNIAVSFESNGQIRTESYAIGFEFVSGLINALKIVKKKINKDAKNRK